MAHGWIIWKDHLGDGCEGTMGPSTIPESIQKRLQLGEGEPFRMLDCEDTLYYSGLLLVDESMDENEDYEFTPLDDFGTPNAGCTDIQYKKNGVWQSI